MPISTEQNHRRFVRLFPAIFACALHRNHNRFNFVSSHPDDSRQWHKQGDRYHANTRYGAINSLLLLLEGIKYNERVSAYDEVAKRFNMIVADIVAFEYSLSAFTLDAPITFGTKLGDYFRTHVYGIVPAKYIDDLEAENTTFDFRSYKLGSANIYRDRTK